jgi:hypothetical protein
MVFSTLRFVNVFLLTVILTLTLTGVYGLFWTLNGWLFDLHRAAGWALIAVLPAKTLISYRSLSRRLARPGRESWLVALSLLLAVLLLGVVGLGLLWPLRLGPELYPLRQTAVSWHWMLALGLLLPLLIHVLKRWPGARRADFLSRRAALRLGGLGAASLVGWRLMDGLASAREETERPRRFSGSRREGAFSGNRFPVTHSLEAEPVDLAGWRLELWGTAGGPRNYTYDELLELPQMETVAALDCTLGWYTVQSWQGLRLADLMGLEKLDTKKDAAQEGRGRLGVRLEAVSGYAHFLPVAEARLVLLATHVGGEALEHLHGFPLRAVVPTRRGWFWVKWLRKIEVVTLV